MSEIVRLVYDDDDFLCHYQVKGAKHGVRRWQYPDGSLTPEGRIHYGVGPARSHGYESSIDEKDRADIDVRRLEYNKSKSAKSAALVDAYNRAHAHTKQGFLESDTHFANRKAQIASKAWDLETKALSDSRDYELAQEEVSKRYSNYVLLADALSQHISAEDVSEEELSLYKKRYKELDRIINTYTVGDLTGGHNLKDRVSHVKEVEKALAKAELPNDTEKFVAKLNEHIVKKGNLNSIKELDSVDVSGITQTLLRGDTTRASRIADDIASKITGDAGREEYGSLSMRQAVQIYLYEKADTEAHGWRDNQSDYMFYNPEEDERSKKRNKKS